MRNLSGSIRRTMMTLLTMIALVFGGTMAFTGPALASGNDYPVNEGVACQNQYRGPQFVALNTYGGPYGWACYSKSFGIPLAVTLNPVGDLKIQEFFCDRYYPGSTATLVYYSANGWRCRFAGNGGW
jgi:hypothetical protein